MNKLMMGFAGLLAVVGCTTVGPVDSGTTFGRDAFKDKVASGHLPGAITIYYNNGVQETACTGYADVAAKRPLTLDDPFMQCSQTKGFCGVTIAKLVEEGKLNLDDPVSKYLPCFSNLSVKAAAKNGVYTVSPAKNAITVRMCLNHTAGFEFELPGMREMGGWSRRMPLQSVAVCAAKNPLIFEPGTKVQYSNVGIDVGAAVVEKITGMRWEEYLQQTVLDPLEMHDTTFWPTEDQLARRIQLYTISTDKKTKKELPAQWIEFNPSMATPFSDDRVFPSAGAGLWSTANDHLKFYKMLMNLGVGDNGVRILKEETVKNLLAKSTRPTGKTADGKDFGGYSLGLNAPVVDKEDSWFGHGGAWQTCCMMNWHRKQLKLVVVQNCGGGSRQLSDAAADKFFKTKIDNSGAAAYTGRMK